MFNETVVQCDISVCLLDEHDVQNVIYFRNLHKILVYEQLTIY